MRLHPTVRALLGSAILLFGANALGQASCPPPAPTAETLRADQLRADVRDRGFLWQITRDGRSSWLYGTVHVSRPDWVLPGPRVQAAFTDSEVLALELDPGDPELMRIFARPGDAARAGRVTAGLDGAIARVAERECVPAATLRPLMPILQLTTLSLVDGRRDGFHPELAIDAVLWGMAKSTGKEVVALETPAAQLAALMPASEADERALLTQGLQEIESGVGRATLRKLLQAWSESDEQVLVSYAQWCQCMDTPEERRYLQRLNDERNPPIADKLAALHASGRTVFAAVGALHMTGPQALPGLLQARGFQVRRIPLSNAPGRP
jgi:uncharacterized protein YbaP (TraB family)